MELCPIAFSWVSSVIIMMSSSSLANTVPPPKLVGLQELPAVTLKLQASRKSIYAGEPWTIFGTIENQGTKPIYVANKYIVITFPVELVSAVEQSSTMGYVWFPTSDTGWSSPYSNQVIRVFPKQPYTFSLNVLPDLPKAQSSALQPITPGSLRDWGRLFREISFNVRRFIFFQPGQYEVSATAHYWLEDPKKYLDDVAARNLPADLSSAPPITTSLPIEVRSSPWVILLGASIGGIFMYLLMWFVGATGATGTGYAKWLSRGAGLVSAAILAAIVTLMLQRIGNTALFVTISVNDFWGATVVGFISQYVGVQILDRIITPTMKGRIAALRG